MLSPALTFVAVLVIGLAAGLLFDRLAGPGWLTRQISGARGPLTSALVGVAGAFTGFHVAVLAGLAGWLPLLAAAACALAVLWLWRAAR